MKPVHVGITDGTCPRSATRACSASTVVPMIGVPVSEVRVVAGDPNAPSPGDGLSVDRLRTLIQDSHLNLLIGAGTPSAFFGRLGDVENTLTALTSVKASRDAKLLVRSSIQAHFFDNVLFPNLALYELDDSAREVVKSYERFLRTLNRILLRRRSTLLGKQVNIFTTNVDMVFEVALEELGIDSIDGFSGKIRPKFDLGEFGTLRLRQGQRYEHRSEVPVFNLYKVHGSASWRLDTESMPEAAIHFDHSLSQIQSLAEAREAAADHLLPIQDADSLDLAALLAEADGRVVDPKVIAFARQYQRLAIVNPEKTKFADTVLNETYYELIRRFANELEKENTVLLVHGFSFRDEHLRDLVLRGARSNPTLQVVIFSYSRNDGDEYRRIFTDATVKNGNVMIVTPLAPVGDGEEIRFDLDRLGATYFAPLIPEQTAGPDYVIQLDVRAQSKDGAGA